MPPLRLGLCRTRRFGKRPAPAVEEHRGHPRARRDAAGGAAIALSGSSRRSAGRKDMPAIGAKRVAVIGAGMVGVCTASWLQRDGHSVFLVEAAEPGQGASFGNAGCFNGSSVTPMSMPGV